MGTYEVTNAQYAAFLNAVAATDTFGLYHSLMSTDATGGIQRSGSSGSYTYTATEPNWPVTFVDWYSAIRFANWLHNGQGGPGTTEYGAYTLLGGTPVPSNADSIVRNPGAKWWLPSENEWYKAANFDPGAASYFLYPTGSNAAPLAEAPPGGSNSANFDFPIFYQVTDVGAYVDSPGPYGTFDQGGNLREWNETLVAAGERGMRGGGWSGSEFSLRSTTSEAGIAEFKDSITGFRVATIPEPSTFALGIFGLVWFIWKVRRGG